MSNSDTHALYRFHDATGTLLYVGITADPGARWRKHAHDKPWWTHIATITVETHPSRAEVLEAERTAILTEKPLHNIVHNRSTARVKPRPTDYDNTVLAPVGADPSTGPFGTHPTHMPDDCHDICVKAGRYAIYFPYRWADGVAHYRCAAGHRWTCGWGHSLTGQAPEHRGVPFQELV